MNSIYSKENAIGFNHGIQTTLESAENLSDNLLFKFINATIIIAFS